MTAAMERPTAPDSTGPRHDPVMLAEILDLLPLGPGGVAVDGTLGLGGHSIEFARRVSPGGTLVATDWDAAMLAFARKRLSDATEGVALHLIHDDFRTLPDQLDRLGLRADGVLLDLGLNSAQVDDPARGLSFRAEGPLDMRMDTTRGEPASALLNRMSPIEIERALHDYADERWARRIASVIADRRRTQPLRTTQDLVDCVLAAIPTGARDKRIHPATRTFQAVRILVNRELDGLAEALDGLARRLNPGGVLAVLTYHSGEDRIVKQTFRALSQEGWTDVFRRPELPTEAEIAMNSRSRSAKLRAVRMESNHP